MKKSSFEHLYTNWSWAGFKRAPGLLRNLGFLVAAFVAIRLGSFVPLPGVNLDSWTTFFSNSPFAH